MSDKSSKSDRDSDSSWRIFAAIEVPTEVRQQVVAHADRLRAVASNVAASWTRMDNIHLTLKFFGNVELERIAKISTAADDLARSFSPIKIELSEPGVFPKHGAPRVLWIGLKDQSDRLSKLQKEFELECARRGFPAEDRAFHPHLTVARLRSPHGARTLGDLHKRTKFDAISFKVTELTVLRSELSSKGSRYTVISTHQLRNDQEK